MGEMGSSRALEGRSLLVGCNDMDADGTDVTCRAVCEEWSEKMLPFRFFCSVNQQFELSFLRI